MSAAFHCIDCGRRVGDCVSRCKACVRLDAAETLVRQFAPKCRTPDCDEPATMFVREVAPYCDAHAPEGAVELPTTSYLRAWEALGGIGSWSRLREQTLARRERKASAAR